MNNDTYALLIGIDCYPTQQPSATRSINLNGCVRDINRIETFLLQRIGIPSAHIRKLTSTNTPSGQPLEPVESWPTRANIISGFRWVEDVAQRGDQVFIYYSGHGARVRTPLKFQQFKPGDGFDEALVPCDYNYDTDQFLRDFEMADILRGYRDRGLEVTIVLDSCHSGGSTRAESGLSNIDKRARTIGVISQTFPDPEIPVASDQDLLTTIRKLSSRTRDFNVEHGWLLEPEGYVLLAACRPAEFAYEHAFAANETSGALTYWLLDSLNFLGPEASFETLYNRILANVHEQFPDQTPQLQGERNRVPFKHERVTATPTVPVLGVNGNEIIVGAGQAQNVSPGQQFAIFRAGETDLGAHNRRALVSVIDVGASSSRAKIVEQFTSAPIEKGDQALALQSGKSELKRTVKLVQPQDTTVEIIRTFHAIEQALRSDQNTYITLSTNGAAADFAVDVDQAHEYVLSATFNGESQRVSTPAHVDKDNAAATVIERLEHMAKYLNVYDLQNHDPISPLRKKVSLELLGVQDEYLPGNKPGPQPLPNDQTTPEFKTGQWTFLKIKNDSTQVLNITVLDLRPNWSINQIYPARAAAFEPLDPGHSLTLPLRASLPDGYDEGTDLIKIVATSGPSNFRFLELPALTEPQVVWRGAPESQLEALQNALTQRNLTRDFDTEHRASAEWTTAEVKLRTVRAK
jgi:hypothetical protein